VHLPALADVPEIVDVPVVEQDHSLAGSLDWGAIASSLAYRPAPPQQQQQQQQQQQVILTLTLTLTPTLTLLTLTLPPTLTLTLVPTLTPDPNQVPQQHPHQVQVPQQQQQQQQQQRQASHDLSHLMPPPHVHHVSLPSLTWLGLAPTRTLTLTGQP
tara:strand:+ start:747 stop:1217 length:471 start_codon:yes stop_codon:yes gene_type:complete